VQALSLISKAYKPGRLFFSFPLVSTQSIAFHSFKSSGMSAVAITTPSHQDLLSRDSKTTSTIFQNNGYQYPPDVENTLDAAPGTARTPRPQMKNLPTRTDSLQELPQIPSGPRRSKTTNHVLQSLSQPSSTFHDHDSTNTSGFNRDTQLTKKLSKVRPVTRRNTTSPDAIPMSEDLDFESPSRKRQSFKRLSRRRRDDDEDRVIIGIRIAEGHQNYVLMYNMLTGIRIAVSEHALFRCFVMHTDYLPCQSFSVTLPRAYQNFTGWSC
jgi:hypothetical protein